MTDALEDAAALEVEVDVELEEEICVSMVDVVGTLVTPSDVEMMVVTKVLPSLVKLDVDKIVDVKDEATLVVTTEEVPDPMLVVTEGTLVTPEVTLERVVTMVLLPLTKLEVERTVEVKEEATLVVPTEVVADPTLVETEGTLVTPVVAEETVEAPVLPAAVEDEVATATVEVTLEATELTVVDGKTVVTTPPGRVETTPTGLRTRVPTGRATLTPPPPMPTVATPPIPTPTPLVPAPTVIGRPPAPTEAATPPELTPAVTVAPAAPTEAAIVDPTPATTVATPPRPMLTLTVLPTLAPTPTPAIVVVRPTLMGRVGIGSPRT